MFRRSLSFFIAAAMLLGAFCAPAWGAPADAEGTVSEEAVVLDRQLTMYSRTDSSKDLPLAEHYLEYRPGAEVTPLMAFGNDVAGAASFPRVFEIESGRGNDIVAGVNGDFYIMSTGVPIGICIRDGVIMSSEHSYNEALGFFADGRAIIGRPELKIRFEDETAGFYIENVAYNKTLASEAGAVLFSGAYNNNNVAKEESLNIVIAITTGSAVAGGGYRGIVTDVREETGRLALSAGELVLSVYKRSYVTLLAQLAEAKPGDDISVSFDMSDEWKDVVQAVGVEARLIADGRTKSFSDNSRAPRTAVGIKKDGTVILYTVDGRQTGYSLGMTYGELARRMAELGCVQAANLDGGDSTQMHAVVPGYTETSLINRNSGGSLRSVANYICFKNNAERVGNVAHLYIYPDEISVYGGQSVTLGLKATDDNYYASKVDASKVTAVFSDDALGTVENCVFTAGGKEMSGDVTLSLGDLSVKLKVNVLTEGEKLDDFESLEGGLANTDLSFVHNGRRSLKLAASGERYSPGKTFTGKYPSMISLWVCGDGSGGSLYADGRADSGFETEICELDFTGWKQVSCRLPRGTSQLSSLWYSGPGVVYIDQLMAGYGDYSDGEAPEITAHASDGKLSAIVEDALDRKLGKSGITVTCDGARIPFSFSQSAGVLSADLPESGGKLHHIVIKAVDMSGNAARAGLEYTAPEAEQPEEATAPAIAFSDMSEANWSLPYAQYLYDKGVISGKPGKDGSLIYDPFSAMTRQEFAKVIVSWLGTDLEAYAGEPLDFGDAQSIAEWAQPYVRAAVGLGMMNGKAGPSGTNFDPSGSITRQEAMTVIGRIMEKGYAPDDLSGFSDASSVAQWALPYVQVLVGQGIINGAGGKLSPSSPVTREQIAKIIFEID